MALTTERRPSAPTTTCPVASLPSAKVSRTPSCPAQRDTSAVELDGVLAECGDQRRMQRGPVNHDQGAPNVAGQLIHGRRVQNDPVVIPGLCGGDRTTGGLDLVTDAQPTQRLDRVGPERDAGTHFAQLRSLLEDCGVDAGRRSAIAVVRPPMPAPTISTFMTQRPPRSVGSEAQCSIRLGEVSSHSRSTTQGESGVSTSRRQGGDRPGPPGQIRWNSRARLTASARVPTSSLR